MSIVVMLLAATATVVAIDTPSSDSENVPAVPAVLAITMLVITVLVADGTVYSVADDVANAPRASAFEIVAISYYTFLC
jgi:nitrate/nitrite transporter NarK